MRGLLVAITLFFTSVTISVSAKEYQTQLLVIGGGAIMPILISSKVWKQYGHYKNFGGWYLSNGDQ